MPDFDLYHDVDDVILAGQMFETKNVLPEAGGLMDQSEAWIHDLMVYTNGLAFFRWAEEQRQKKKREAGNG